MHCQTDYQFSSDTCGLSCKFWRSREESRGGTNSFTYPLCLNHTTVIVFKTQMPFTIGLGSVHRGQAFRIVDTGNSKRCHRLEKLKYSPPVGMRLRVSSSTYLCRLRTVTSASETEAETDCETGLLPEVSPQTLIEMERVRNSKDASTSATPRSQAIEGPSKSWAYRCRQSWWQSPSVRCCNLVLSQCLTI